ncbi:MFS transporter [Nitriliruptoraceae bacterium ZYF776]|nr:MFS transporter [Profundirhabdus halotolerans]
MPGRSAWPPSGATVAALLALVLGMAPVALVGALAVPLREQAGVGDTTLGLGVGIFFAGAGVSARLLGRLVDRLGWRRSLQVAAVACGGVLVGLGVGVRSPTSLLVVLALGGCGAAFATVASNLALSQVTPEGRLGLAVGINQSAVPAGTLLAGLSVPTVALWLGWRWPPVLAAGGAIVLLVVAARATTGSAAGVSASPIETDAVPEGVGRPAGRAGLRAVGAACFLAGLAPGALATFLVVTSVEVGYSQAGGGLLLAVSGAGGVLVRVGAGWAVDRAPERGLVGSASLVAVGAVGLLALASRDPVLVGIGGVLGFAGGWGWTGLIFFWVLRTFRAGTGAAVASVVGGGSLGAAIGPGLFGMLAEGPGHTVAWSVMAACAAAGALLLHSTHRARTVAA